MGWWMLLGTVWSVVFWGVILHFSGSAVSRSGGRRDEENPLEILKRRYARGELSAQEFERMRQELTQAMVQTAQRRGVRAFGLVHYVEAQQAFRVSIGRTPEEIATGREAIPA